MVEGLPESIALELSGQGRGGARGRCAQEGGQMEPEKESGGQGTGGAQRERTDKRSWGELGLSIRTCDGESLGSIGFDQRLPGVQLLPLGLSANTLGSWTGVSSTTGSSNASKCAGLVLHDDERRVLYSGKSLVLVAVPAAALDEL